MLKNLKFSISNIVTIILAGFVLLMLFNPNAKGWFIETLMKVGLFQPVITNSPKPVDVLSSEVVFRDINGNTLNLADQKGKVIFINFWATWCPPCIAEMPSINSLYHKFKNSDNIIFVIADADGDFNASTKFMRKKDLHFPLYISTGILPKTIFEGTLPTTVIINKKGEIVYRHEGAADYDSPKMVSFINELSKASFKY